MTEQLGIVYPDCSEGNKHVPIFADVLIRDIHNQQILPHRTPGFIQTLCPTPNSYPGISVLTDDIGEVLGEDDCPFVVVEANILYLKRGLRLQSQRDAETHLQFRNIITKGQINEKSEDDISNIINSLKDHQPWLHELSVDDII